MKELNNKELLVVTGGGDGTLPFGTTQGGDGTLPFGTTQGGDGTLPFGAKP